MRLNKYIAQATGLSRRAADAAVAAGRVRVNGAEPEIGLDISDTDTVELDSQPIQAAKEHTTVLLNKPVGYVVSRDGQGSSTIYDILPPELHNLKAIGRLDKPSSGLLLLTDDGGLAHELTHPSRQKRKVYEVTLDKPLQPLHRQLIAERGIALEDGVSRLDLDRQDDGDDNSWFVSMHEGRNRQIRRTFAALGYNVTRLHRIVFGPYTLHELASGKFTKINSKK